MNNHNENKDYFKDTFKVFHAPENTTKEVLNMAKRLSDINQDDANNIVQESVSTNTKRNLYAKCFAIACAFTIVIGGGTYLHNMTNRRVAVGSNSTEVATEIETIQTPPDDQQKVVAIGNSESENIKYDNFMGTFYDVENLSVSYEYRNDSMEVASSSITGALTPEEVDLINQAIDLTTCTVSNEDTFNNNNPKYNQDLINQDVNPNSASITFDSTGTHVIVYIINNNIAIYYYDGSTLSNTDYYTTNDTKLLDTINDIVKSNVENVYIENTITETSSEDSTLFGIIPLSEDDTFQGSVGIVDEVTTNLTYDDIMQINQASNYENWFELDFSSSEINVGTNQSQEDNSYSDVATIYINSNDKYNYIVTIFSTVVEVQTISDDEKFIDYYSTNEPFETDTDIYAERLNRFISMKIASQETTEYTEKTTEYYDYTF